MEKIFVSIVKKEEKVMQEEDQEVGGGIRWEELLYKYAIINILYKFEVESRDKDEARGRTIKLTRWH